MALVFFSCCEVGCYRTSGITNDGIDELTERVSLLLSAHTPSAWMFETLSSAPACVKVLRWR